MGDTAIKGATPSDLQAAVNAEHLPLLCDEVIREWRKLGVSLGLSITQLRIIATNYPNDCRERVWEVLDTWVQMKGDEATVGSLKNALEKMERNDVAQKLIGLLNSTWEQSGSARREVEKLGTDVKNELRKEVKKQLEDLDMENRLAQLETCQEKMKKDVDNMNDQWQEKSNELGASLPAGKKFPGKGHRIKDNGKEELPMDSVVGRIGKCSSYSK